MVICNEHVLAKFGQDILAVSKPLYLSMRQKTAFYCIMDSRPGKALTHLWKAAQSAPLNPRTILMVPLCFGGARLARNLYKIIKERAAGF